MSTVRERLEAEQLVKIAADWRCQRCGAEHGQPHPEAPSVRVFLRVVAGETRCQVCSESIDGGTTVSDDQDFTDTQFEAQLELEEMSVDAVRDAGAAAKARCSRFEQVTVTIRVHAALGRSPLSREAKAEKLAAWLEGLGLTFDEYEEERLKGER